MVKSQGFPPQGGGGGSGTVSQQLYNYLVYFDGGSSYNALNGVTGVVDKSSTNAATTIQYAIDNLPAAGGVIRIKDGTFPLGSTGLTITLSGTKFIDFGGIGGASTLLTYTGSGYALTVSGSTSSLQSCKIHDLRLDGTTKTSGRHGIKDQSIGPLVYHENLYLRNFDDAFTIYNSNNRHVRNIRIVTANTGIRTLKGGANTPPNACFIGNYYISDCANEAINIVSDVAGETATVIDIRDGVIEGNTGTGILVTGYPTALTIDSLYVEGNGGGAAGIDVYVKGVNSTFFPTNVILRNIRGRGNVTSPQQNHMIRLDNVGTILIENCLAVNYATAMVVFGLNAEYKVNIVNPGLTEGTPYLLNQLTALTTGTARFAGTVSQNRQVGIIALLPSSHVTGDVVVLSTSGRFAATSSADQNNPAVVMYPAAAGDTPGVVVTDGIAQVNTTAAITLGDTLATSTTQAKATTNNTQTDPKKIVGYAMETTGAAGAVWAKVL